MSSNKNRKQNLVSKKGMDNDYFSVEEEDYLDDFTNYVIDLTTILKISYEKDSSWKNQPYIKYGINLKDENFYKFIDDFQNAYESLAELKILNRSLFISQMSSFERIRNKNLTLSAKKIEGIKGRILDAFANLPEDKRKKLLPEVVKQRDRVYDFIDKYPHGLFKLEKSVYEIYKLTKKSDEIKKVLDLFLIYRELRNLIVHRSKVIDDKVLKSLKTSGSFNPPKTFDELSKRAKIQVGPESQIFIQFESIINCHFNILKLSFLYFSLGFKDKLEELKKVGEKNKMQNFLSDTLAEILNDTLCFTINVKEGYLKEELLNKTMGFVGFCFKFCNESIIEDDTLFVNVLLLANAVKRSSYDAKDYKKFKMDTLVKNLEIQDEIKKAIVNNFIDNDIDNFVNNIEKLCKREEKNNGFIPQIGDWYMIQVFNKEPSVERLLRSNKSYHKKMFEKTKKD